MSGESARAMRIARARGTSLLLVIALGFTALGAGKCAGKKGAIKPAAAKSSAIPDSADQVTFGFRAIVTDQGVSKGLLLSDKAFVYDDGTRLVLDRVNFTFYTGQGLKDGVMTSRTGIYNTRLSRLEARGDVVVTRDDGKRLTSQQLVYDQARNQIFTDSAFVLNEPSRQLTGNGFESDPRMTAFRCIRNCKILAPLQVPRK